MAKKSHIQKNLSRLKKAVQFSSKRELLKSRIYDKSLDNADRLHLVFKLSKLPRNSSRVRYRNRCNITGRPHGYYRRFGLSRIAIRDLASQGLISGLKKSSW